MEQLDFIRHAGETRRFHTWPVLRQQNVAEHSWHVAQLLFLMYGGQEPGITIALLMAGLTHDMAECQVGDIPSPAKRAMSSTFPNFREKWGEMEQRILHGYEMDWEGALSNEEKRRLKLADVMEGALYCVRERAMGNTLIDVCYRNFANYIGELMTAGKEEVPFEKLDSVTLRELDVWNYIHNGWEQANER